MMDNGEEYGYSVIQVREKVKHTWECIDGNVDDSKSNWQPDGDERQVGMQRRLLVPECTNRCNFNAADRIFSLS